MRAATLSLFALAAIACEEKLAPPVVDQPSESITIPHQPTERELAPQAPTVAVTPTIPGQLLEKLAIEREGSFALPDSADELTLSAAVALGEGLAFVGRTWTRSELDPVGQSRRWIVVGPDKGPTRELELDAGSIHAAISDGQGGALLVGTDGPSSATRAWFGAIDERGKLTSSVVLDGVSASETSVEMVDVLAGHGDGERALLLGNVGTRGLVVSVDARGAIRWQRSFGEDSPTQILAGERVPGEQGDVLMVGSQMWWARLAGPVDAESSLEQGKFEIEAADPIRTLDAIVALGHDMGFIALGRAKREQVQAHDQVIAVGFDRAGQPTWTRLLDHFRGIQIYGAAVHPEAPGAAQFVARIPIGGDEPSALCWIEMYGGVDGILVARQLAGTIGWDSAGFLEGRTNAAITTYRRTEAGIEWRVLPIDSGAVWADPRR